MIAHDLTLVIVGYKHERYVGDLLLSLQQQTILPSRILLIDDDPAGETADAAEVYLEENPLHVSIQRNRVNRGLCASLNSALSTIDTEFYAYISADDWMLPTRFERQLEAMAGASADVAVVYSNALRVDEHGKQLERDFKTEYAWPPRLSGSVYSELCEYNWLPAPSVMLRTQSVKEAGGYDPDLFFEDHDLWIRLALKSDFLCVDEPLVAFRELGSSLGHQQFHTTNPRFVMAYLQIFSKQLGITPELDAEMQNRIWTLALRLWRIEGPTPRVVDYLKTSFRSAPNRVTARVYVLLARAGVRATAVDRVRGFLRAPRA